MNNILLVALSLTVFAIFVSGNSRFGRSDDIENLFPKKTDYRSSLFYTSSAKFSEFKSKFNMISLKTSRKISYVILKSYEMNKSVEVDAENEGKYCILF
jgi:hypothetical protein